MNADGSCPIVVSSADGSFVPEKGVIEPQISVGAIVGIVIGIIALGLIAFVVVKKVCFRKEEDMVQEMKERKIKGEIISF